MFNRLQPERAILVLAHSFFCMGSIHRLTDAVRSQWQWLWRCWLLRSAVAELLADAAKNAAETEKAGETKAALREALDAKHLLEIELTDLKQRMEKHLETHEIAKEGNRALLRFVHTRHRLNVPFDPKSIRGALQAADQRKP